MARSVHQILGLLGTKDPAAVLVYPLPLAKAVWGADFGRLTASVTSAEKDALVAAGAREQAHRG